MNLIQRWWQQAPATVAFCAAMILAYVATAIQSLSLVDNLSRSGIADASILYLPDMYDAWGPMRALTSAFMHIGPGHLALNLVLLFLLGREIEQYAGRGLYILVWLTAAIGASTLTVWLDPINATAGASGVGYALMALLVGVVMQRGGDLRAPIVLIIVNIAFTVITPGISLWGHLGGLLAGFLLSVALLPRSRGWRACCISMVLIGYLVALFWRLATFTTSGLWSL
ncbi:rhomboid family intramembrane serine protease [Corynebacterium sp. H128]|uniref:rhomboid family intramembrane serine protease n=1 Tax=Corynebacterium sp. H128 TaxID=3133427 RepID=UPI0030AB64D2